MNQQCENCRYYSPRLPLPRGFPPYGDCRRYSPVASTREEYYRGRWPEVDSEAWCGEWEAKNDER